jgi:mono/diheme cytochrome c family protein
MKSSFALSLAAAFLASAGTAFATEMQQSPKKMAMSGTSAEMSHPHFKSTGTPVSAARGETIFVDHCALCHGLHGKGDGPRSAFFQPGVQYIPDLTLAEFLKGRDKELMQSIREGLRRLPEPAYVMPQFKYILSDEEIRSVLAYVKTLPKAAAKH